MRRSVGFAMVLIVLVLLEAARVYVWQVQQGVYEYAVAVYLSGIFTSVGVTGALLVIDRKSRE